MAFRLSNNLLGILNFMTFLLSILGAGIWLSREGLTECKHFLDRPIYVGVFLMAVSLAGMIGACCRVTWLLWLYVVVMFLLIVLGVVFTVFAFVVTNKGAGETLPGRGYKEYRLGDYSNWLQKRVSDGKNWNKIKSCLADSKVCTDFNDKYLNVPVTEFYREHLSSVQSGCCKPSDDCQFKYVGPTNWTRGSAVSTNPDCSLWDNNMDTLYFNCQSCKAGFMDNLRSSWKKVAVVNIVCLVFLIIDYSVGCCAFRNNRRDDHYQQPWKP
ncbi:tetraspanin-8-like [Hibiscus syriacus]|uniref:tetraspanin-8-like n=1 Tax=Hibiscus syriacus TaxID=106335 RepID=UPI00192429FE|nr:tetraspanin-8-like [Hibiscus syriacus]